MRRLRTPRPRVRNRGTDAGGGRPKRGLGHFLKIFGPGIITGAADDDPSGIATYAQTGAQFGFGQLWTALYQIPLLLAIQGACGRIGAVTGKGLAAVIKQHYSRTILISVVLLVVVANTINIGADIAAVGEATNLIVPIPRSILVVATALLIVTIEIVVSYETFAKVLKWLALALLAYPATTFMVKQPWGDILYATFVPHIEFTASFLFIITGVFGTSISPYMFFWQASEEVEEEHARHLPNGKNGEPRLPRSFITDMRIDTTAGMIAAEAAQWFIIITTASVLYRHGVTNIKTAADAAKALEPLVQSFPNAGEVARIIFAVGIVGLGLLGIPVLSGAAAYALSEAFGWQEGLSRKWNEAPGFYGVITVATLVGVSLNFIGLDPMKALVFSAVFNGIAAIPLLFVIARINSNSAILGSNRGGLLSRWTVWLTFGVMALSGAALLYTSVSGR